jgi:hypothetical protein
MRSICCTCKFAGFFCNTPIYYGQMKFSHQIAKQMYLKANIYVNY